jgi:radical SAM protein with 4Fe4S-binding SPASM domain
MRLISLRKIKNLIEDREDRLLMQLSYFLDPEKRSKNRTCTVFKDLQVNVDGSVFHCAVKNELLGNIKNDSISDIWSSEHTKKMRLSIVNCNINCHQLINCSIPRR